MLRHFVRSVRTVLADRKGVTAAEYAILAVGIVIVVGAAVGSLRSPLANAFSGIGAQITSTQSSVSAGGTR